MSVALKHLDWPLTFNLPSTFSWCLTFPLTVNIKLTDDTQLPFDTPVDFGHLGWHWDMLDYWDIELGFNTDVIIDVCDIIYG